ncbi:TolC family protein [Geobacter hydrogenophilus]|uniref:Protein CyaE n=2 Tax=Geobacter hydrogenophilus TaxID=40983 RepID=A0A9W6L9N8_9BACT|nr:TolC family protein [Geobacter hydrogenophilus]GLI36627.1 protein CyaE [Geobacter hydrogenophilus]
MRKDQKAPISRWAMNRLLWGLVAVLSLAGAAHAETLSLDECLRRAAAGNYGLTVTAHDRRIAAENISLAKSGFLPRLDFQGGYTAQAKPQAFSFAGRETETQDATYGFFNITATQTIYDFGRTSSRTRRASLLQEAVSHSYDAQERDVFLQVVEAYYGILEAKKVLGAADEEIVQRTDHLRVAQNLYEQGVVTRNDLLQAEVKLADSRQRRLAATNLVENRWLFLNYLTGRPLPFRADLEEKDTPASLPPLEAAEEKALANRPELAALARTVEAGEAEVSEARTGYFPEIFAQGSIDYMENSKAREQAIYAATVGLRVNLFDGLATTSRYRQTVENLGKQRDNLRLAREQIRLELATSQNDARVAAERIRTVETAIKQGEENLRINRDRYQAQVGTATDVIDAQTLLTQIRTDYFRAVFDYQVAAARVRKAMGEL